MPEDNAGNGGEQEQQDNGAKGEQFTPITSQEDFERLLGRRLERERAKFADYDDLKAKASKFDEAEQASKSELEKERERANALEQRAAQAERNALQTRVATELGVPVEVVHGDDEEAMRAAAQKVIAWRDSNKKPAPSPKSLKSGSSGSDDDGGSRAAAAVRRLRGTH